MYDWQVYCSICGAPIDSGTGQKWFDDAMLLTSVHKTESGTEIDAYFPSRPIKDGPYPFDLGHDPPDSQRNLLRLSARSEDGSNIFFLSESGEKVFALRLQFDQHPGGPRHGAPLYVPVHRLCLQLADNFISSTKTSLILAGIPDDGLTSAINLWEILHRRLPSYCQSRTTITGHTVRVFEYNPYDIPNLTSSLLENLTPAPAPIPTDNQSWNISALHNGHLLPWLFDLDFTQILEKQASGNWDWHGLIQRLMVPSIHEYDDTSLNLPLGLRNRRRIWRILEEARVHDVAGEDEARRKLHRETKEALERTRKEQEEFDKKFRADPVRMAGLERWLEAGKRKAEQEMVKEEEGDLPKDN